MKMKGQVQACKNVGCNSPCNPLNEHIQVRANYQESIATALAMDNMEYQMHTIKQESIATALAIGNMKVQVQAFKIRIDEQNTHSMQQ
jgi:hypothetical protein